MAEPQRREFLGLALGGAFAAATRTSVVPAAAEPLATPVPFAPDTVLSPPPSSPQRLSRRRACRRSRAPCQISPSNNTPRSAGAPETAIWADDKLGFSLEPLHRGFVFTTPITINIVENGLSQKVIYDPADFDFGKLQQPSAIGDLGFSGLRILGVVGSGI